MVKKKGFKGSRMKHPDFFACTQPLFLSVFQMESRVIRYRYMYSTLVYNPEKEEDVKESKYGQINFFYCALHLLTILFGILFLHTLLSKPFSKPA